MSSATFFWHDYETFGIDPQRDRPCQFAGIRTDLDFNIIGDPLMLYCRPSADTLPHPEACLITGITPQLAQDKGVSEAEFSRLIHQQMAQAGTCSLGYNSIRFDDEVSRNLFYRNFYDPYAREWQNGNSRWDIIDLARAARALRPDGIEWPVNADGVASFRLEELTQANGIAHQAAHDALADVYATIAIARLISQRQPKLYHYLFAHRLKNAALKLLQVGSYTPLLHVSGRFAAKNNCLAVVVPLCLHPSRNNEVIVYDLACDPEPLLALSAEEIRQRLFIASDALPEGVSRIPLKTVHINKYPVLAPLSVLTTKDQQRLAIDLPQCMAHLQQIKAAQPLETKLGEVFSRDYAEAASDPDLMIYSGGFFCDKDRALMNKIPQKTGAELANFTADFQDQRLAEMLFRYRARNFPDSLSAAEQQRWQQFCRDKLHGKLDNRQLTLAMFADSIAKLQNQPGKDPVILQQLADYAASQALAYPLP